MPRFDNSAPILKTIRLKQNLTQREYGPTLGVPESQFVSNWERGLCLPPVPAMRKILRSLTKDERLVLKRAFFLDVGNHYWDKFK